MKQLLLALILMFSGTVMADGFQSAEEAKAFSDSLMEQFLQEEFNDAFARVKPYWPIPELEIDGMLNQVQQQWPVVQQRFGAPKGIEFIREERIGNSLLRYYYLHKFENHAIYWQMDLYKPDTEWRINKLLFLDSLEDLFE